MTKDLLLNLRVALALWIVCAALYPALLLAFAKAVVPGRAEGSLLHDREGNVVGSRLLAQAFRRPEYVWPRPSAVDYNASATGGSNLAPSNPALTERAAAAVVRLAASPALPAPGELVAASGSGMDPHITLAGALYQAERIALARSVAASRIEEVLRREATSRTPWSPPLVNVLEANLALDRRFRVARR